MKELILKDLDSVHGGGTTPPSPNDPAKSQAQRNGWCNETGNDDDNGKTFHDDVCA